jgi:hypothetical protein
MSVTFASESSRILHHARSESLPSVMSAIDDLERSLLPRCRTAKQRGRLMQSSASLRLMVMELRREPFDECRPFADRVLQISANSSPFSGLEALASFARYALECRRAEDGLYYLRAAMGAVDWSEVTKLSEQEARGWYEGLLRELEASRSGQDPGAKGGG